MLKDLKNPDKIRFSANEIQEASEYGLDLGKVKSLEDLAAEEVAWIEALPDTPEGLAIIEKLLAMAESGD